MQSWTEIEQMLASGNLQEERTYLEYKEAKNDLPKSFWESYSAFANQSGGFILLGISENGGLHISGVQNAEHIQELVFSQSRSREKVSAALLRDDDVRLFDIQGKQIVVVYVPKAEAAQRPVHLNQDFRRSYVRLKTGDHKLNESELRSFLSSYTHKDFDGHILPYATLDHLNLGTLNKYRNYLKSHNPTSSLLTLSDEKFIEEIGVLSHDIIQNKQGITYAGLLLFGKGNIIKSVFKSFFFEYYEKSDENHRYDLRITDFDLDDGNLFEFYLKIAPLITALGKDNHFKLDNLTRTEENEITDSLREALVNAIAHADYFNDARHLKIIKTKNQISFENAGVMLIDVHQAIIGNRSECRNGTIHNILRRIGLCERQGQGVRDIFTHWQSRYFNTPVLESEIDYTKLTLTFHDGKIANWEEKLTACYGLRFSKLKPIPKDCLLYIAINGQQATHKDLVQGIPQYTGRAITLALAHLKEKGFVKTSGEKRSELIYHLVGFEEEIENESENDYIEIKDKQVSVNSLLNNVLENPAQPENNITLQKSDHNKQETPLATPLVREETPLATPLAKLLVALGNEEKGIVQLGIDLAVMDKKNIRKTYISPALKLGLIEMTLPEKPTSPNQKYRRKKG